MIERSGARIKVIVWTNNGAELWRKALHDVEKDVDCTVRLAEDGALRCLPKGTQNETEYGQVVFEDERCTRPIMQFVSDTSLACGDSVDERYLVYPVARACPRRTVVVAQGPEMEQPADVYVADDDRCTKQDPLYSNGKRFYYAKRSPAVQWARFTRSVHQVTRALGIEKFTGDDGSVVDGTTRLLPEDVECSSLRSWPDRCIPERAGTTGAHFSDSACSTPVAIVSKGYCPQPMVVESGSQLFEVGESIEATDVRSSFSTSSCTPLPAPEAEWFKFYAIGAPLRPESFPELMLEATGPGPVRKVLWTSERQTVGVVDGWGALGKAGEPVGASCSPENVSGDAKPCARLLELGYPTYFYADRQCSVPILRGPSDDDPAGRYAMDSRDRCEPHFKVRQVTTPYSGVVYQDGFPCTKHAPAAKDRFFSVGPPQDVAEALPMLVPRMLPEAVPLPPTGIPP